MRRLRHFACTLACAALFVFTFAGCDGTGTSEEESPEVIAPASFNVDIKASFPQLSGTAIAAKSENSHVGNAAFRVAAISALVELNLIIPQAVTAAALQADPIVEDGTWIWESTAAWGESQSTAFRLEGTPEGQHVDWSMSINTTDQGVTEFYELFTADTALDGEDGTWSLYYKKNGQRVKVLEANFNVESDTKKEITFTVAEGADDNAGDTVQYRQDGSMRAFVWTQVDPAEVVTVEWDHETKAGFMIAPNYWNGEKVCWDTNLENVACE